jgi:hypothetical protein
VRYDPPPFLFLARLRVLVFSSVDDSPHPRLGEMDMGKSSRAGFHHMCMKLTVPALLGIAAFGQTRSGTLQEARFEITHAETLQNLHGIGDAIRAVTGVRVLSLDEARRSLAIRGTAEQLAAADWVAGQLDQPISRVGEGAAEYRVTRVNALGQPVDEVLRLIRTRHVTKALDLVELAGAIQTVAKIRCATYVASGVMILRGTPEELRLSEWLASELDQPFDTLRAGKSEYRGGPEDVTSVYRLTNTESPGDVQEIVRALDTPASWLSGHRVFAYNPGRAILVRSDSRQLARTSAADEIAITDWLVKQLDQPPATTSYTSEDYRVPAGNEFVHVYHLTNRETMWQLRNAAEQAFGKGRGRVSSVDIARAVVVYGDAEALATAERVKRQIEP